MQCLTYTYFRVGLMGSGFRASLRLENSAMKTFPQLVFNGHLNAAFGPSTDSICT